MKKVLVVEDDKFLANAFRVKLGKEGYETKIALDGDEAIEQLATFTPDLIILDLLLPKKDGFEVLKEIKARDVWKSIPVLIASNLGQKEDIERGMNLGAIDYIVKSDLTMKGLLVKVDALTGKKSDPESRYPRA